MSDPRSWMKNEAAVNAAKEEIIAAMENSGDTDGLSLAGIYGESHEFDGAGTYTLEIPEYVKSINITACGGGGGGAYQDDYTGGGGGGGAAIVREYFNVVPGSKLAITIGAGGGGGGSLGDGGSGADSASQSEKNGTRGGGGGGCSFRCSSTAGKGGDGYAKITWGLASI